jgi:hypothetical protein
MSLSRSLCAPGRLRDVSDFCESVVTAREPVLDVSFLKAKSERGGDVKEWLIRPSQIWFTIRGKPGLVIEAKGN